MTANTDPRERLAALQREWQELNDSLPRHSTPASMLIRLEELEDEINALQAAIARGQTSDDA
jgi:hypothetical protein